MVGLVERKVSTIKPTYLNFGEFLMKIGMETRSLKGILKIWKSFGILDFERNVSFGEGLG